METLNKEELRRQIKEGKEISLDGILDDFKALIRETSKQPVKLNSMII
jgi:hypothetical protein